MAAVHEIWARAVWAAVDIGRQFDVSPQTLFAGLPFDAVELRRRRLVAWSDYCVIIDRIAEAAGSWTELEDVMAADYHRVLPELRSVAAATVSPYTFVWFLFEVIDPLVFPPIAFRLEDLGDRRVRISGHARPGVRPCEGFFRGTTGAIRGMTAHLNLPMAELLATDVGPSHGVWEVRLPESRTLAHRAQITTRQLFTRLVLGAERDGTPISVTLDTGGLDANAARRDRATNEWKLTPRQARVLALLVDGRSNQEIGRALDCADSIVEHHVTHLLRKANVGSRGDLIARFWGEL